MAPKPRFAEAGFQDIIGSGFHGYLAASYEELVEKLGLPHDCTKDDEWKAMDDKVRVEWAFKSIGQKRPMILTIYDYKDLRPITQVNQWHIGLKGDAHQVNSFFLEKKLYTGALEVRKKYR